MKILALSLALATVAAHAETPLWVTVSTDAKTKTVYALKRGSCEPVTNDKGVRTLVCIERQTASNDMSVFHYVAINRDTCPTGVGEILTSDMRGTLLADDQVVAGGGTIASQEWEFMCVVASNIK